MTAQSLFDDAADAPSEQRARAAADASSPSGSSIGAATSLYRRYRPQSFDAAELVGQDHVVTILRNAIVLGRVGHAYLFSGPRGTGKTTTARLLAKAVNCLVADAADRPCNVCPNCRAINAGASPDIIEIDAASNRGIDDIRDLRERVRYAPAQLPSKFYIIDEAHQITGAAANAFLKTLEEPPAHTRFILATTDPEELLPTIVSRCQRLEFHRISADSTVRRLREVAEREGIAIDDDALRATARHATGSLRDALGLLEQLAIRSARPGASNSANPITALDVQAVLGLSRNDRVEGLADAIARRSAADALRIVGDAIDAGEDPRQLNRQLVRYLRLLLLERSGASSEGDQRAGELAAAFTLRELAAHATRFSEIDFSIKHSPYPQLPLEVALVEASEPPESSSQVAAAEPSVEPAGAAVNAALPRPTTSLRDRVRGASAIRVADAAPPAPDRPSAAITPLRPVEPEQPRSTGPSTPGDVDVDRIAELWPRVRADVKALNRRIEALLSEVDPVAVSGNAITLAVPYPFHRDKLNSDDVRETVSGVLSRLLGREVWLNCIWRGEAAGLTSDSGRAQTDAVPAIQVEEAPLEAAESEERAEMRLRAAINIFDAEEVEHQRAETAQVEES
jgi:DNA polymerase-3 subunit gamma/tau